MKTCASSKELQHKLNAFHAEHRARAADPVAKLTAYALVDATVDADQPLNKLLVRATNVAGAPVDGVFIDYRVIDENETGSAFVLDGEPISSSVGLTAGGDGFSLAMDSLLTGKKPGAFIVRATAPESADPATVFADFTITISTQVATRLRVVDRGSPSVPVGDLVLVEVVIELLDQTDEPITFGSIQSQMYDPNETGSLYWWNGVVNYIETALRPGGTPLQGYLIPDDGNTGNPFFLRVDRNGRGPHIDIPYLGIQLISPPAPAR